MSTLYDICIVGAGMVGSAAAKWLSREPGIKVCLLGPQEPTPEEWRSEKRNVFSSYYDEGRITRELDPNITWATLAQRSIQEYDNIERESGIQFYEEVGCLFIDEEARENIKSTIENAEEMNLDTYEHLSTDELRKKYPYMRIGDGWQGLLNFKNAGHISPRRLVAAQQKVAEAGGCDVVVDIAVTVTDGESEGDGRGGDVVMIQCESGRKIQAKKALLCTGAFTNCHRLLPGDKQVDFYPCQSLVLKLELTEEDVKNLSAMPCILCTAPGLESYILPPIQYPDGKYYLKLGGWSRGVQINDLAEIGAWFRSQGENHEGVDSLHQKIMSLIPGLNPVSMATACCVSSPTPTDHLFCDMITPRLGAAVCMVGRGAKSSDEIGRMAACMIAKGSWDYDLPAEYFRLRYRPSKSE
ncbi:monomeric sarcosine oxidase-like [Diadema antillarum]|uniref:monomeric sarcosine oxidase-like n=1 Tax=Diadema antillarum TaxID=105358 RepID=UPI003A8957A9